VNSLAFRSSFLLISAIVLVSCFGLGSRKEAETNVELVPIRVNDYELSIPSYMKKADLNEDASLQFQNVFRETYVIVIDENAQEVRDAFLSLGEYDTTRSTVDNYTHIQMSSMQESINITSQSEVKSLTIHGLEARQVEINGRVEGVPGEIYYLVTFVDGHENLYMVMSWTLTERKEKYSETFKKMAKTFKLM
jgi:hypothetical protein